MRGAVLVDAKAALLVVSRDSRNKMLKTVIVAEVQLGIQGINLPSAISLAEADPIEGVVLTDYLWTVDKAILDKYEWIGTIGEETQESVDAGLRAALQI